MAKNNWMWVIGIIIIALLYVNQSYVQNIENTYVFNAQSALEDNSQGIIQINQLEERPAIPDFLQLNNRNIFYKLFKSSVPQTTLNTPEGPATCSGIKDTWGWLTGSRTFGASTYTVLQVIGPCYANLGFACDGQTTPGTTSHKCVTGTGLGSNDIVLCPGEQWTFTPTSAQQTQLSAGNKYQYHIYYCEDFGCSCTAEKFVGCGPTYGDKSCSANEMVATRTCTPSKCAWETYCEDSWIDTSLPGCSVAGCTPKWVCKDSSTEAYQTSTCSYSTTNTCSNGCDSSTGRCKPSSACTEGYKKCGSSGDNNLYICEGGQWKSYAFCPSDKPICTKVSDTSLQCTPTIPPTTCPNGACDNGETCTTCPADCGTCSQTQDDFQISNLLVNGVKSTTTAPVSVNQGSTVNLQMTVANPSGGIQDNTMRVECGIYSTDTPWLSSAPLFSIANLNEIDNCILGQIGVDTKEVTILEGQSGDVSFIVAAPKTDASKEYVVFCEAFECCSVACPSDIGQSDAKKSPLKLVGTLKEETCVDGIKNNGESDIDCGGPNCNKCTKFLLCTADSDCESGTICDPRTNTIYDTQKRCYPPCQYDSTCGTGYVCNIGHCVASSEKCPGQIECADGTCVDLATDCPGGKTCKIAEEFCWTDDSCCSGLTCSGIWDRNCKKEDVPPPPSADNKTISFTVTSLPFDNWKASTPEMRMSTVCLVDSQCANYTNPSAPELKYSTKCMVTSEIQTQLKADAKLVCSASWIQKLTIAAGVAVCAGGVIAAPFTGGGSLLICIPAGAIMTGALALEQAVSWGCAAVQSADISKSGACIAYSGSDFFAKMGAIFGVDPTTAMWIMIGGVIFVFFVFFMMMRRKY